MLKFCIALFLYQAIDVFPTLQLKFLGGCLLNTETPFSRCLFRVQAIWSKSLVCYILSSKLRFTFWLLELFSPSRSLKRALDRRLYLLLYGPSIGAPDEKPIWHFPEKVYETEETLRKVRVGYRYSSVLFFIIFYPSDFQVLQCAESALKSVLGDLSHTYFVGNAPMGHMVVPPTETAQVPTLKVYIFY